MKMFPHSWQGRPAEEDNVVTKDCNWSWKENRNLLERLPRPLLNFQVLAATFLSSKDPGALL